MVTVDLGYGQKRRMSIFDFGTKQWVGFTSNMVINILFWLFLGVALGDVLKWRNHNLKLGIQA